MNASKLLLEEERYTLTTSMAIGVRCRYVVATNDLCFRLKILCVPVRVSVQTVGCHIVALGSLTFSTVGHGPSVMTQNHTVPMVLCSVVFGLCLGLVILQFCMPDA